MPSTLLILSSTLLMLTMNLAFAKASPEEAVQLNGPELTPLGAERAGNAEGTIPPWTGGMTQPLPGYELGDHHPDPFPDDQILYTINAANLDQYADKLTAGQQAVLRAYPNSWRMNIYPTRRSMAYPEFVYEALKSNATSAELVLEGRQGVQNSIITSPFPIPKTGLEAVWNHNLRWRGMYIERNNGVVPVTPNGHYRPTLIKEEMVFPYAFPGTHPV